MRTIEGIDPDTGDVLVVEVSSRIESITRRATTTPEDLPLLIPGLVDLQVNGFSGYDVNAESPRAETIIAITEELAARGVTSWVPTVVTAPEEMITGAIAAVSEACATHPATARAVPFVHVEGPFLSSEDGPRGVHDRAAIRPIDADEVERWKQAGHVGYVTLSPHDPAAPQQISKIVGAGTAVAIGHTHASPTQIRAAVDAGAEMSTHLGNGIFPTLPRHPNPIWEQLADPRLVCGFIADGHHLPPATLMSMIRAAGPGRSFLVSDSVELAGAAPGKYSTPVGGFVELRKDGRLSYTGTDLLAGAARDLSAGLAVSIAAGLGPAEAVSLVTRTPGRIARRLGGGRRGEIIVGLHADLVELDRAGKVLQVHRSGGSSS